MSWPQQNKTSTTQPIYYWLAKQDSILFLLEFYTKWNVCVFCRLQIKPIGILLTLLFGVWIYKETCLGLTLVTPPELNDKLQRTYARLMAWRQEQPRNWCIVMSGGLLALALIGHIVSGSSIVVFGLLLAALIFSRHKFSIVKDENATLFGKCCVQKIMNMLNKA